MFKPIVLLTVYLKQKLFLDGSNVQYFIIPYIILRKLLTNNLFLKRILDYSCILWQRVMLLLIRNKYHPFIDRKWRCASEMLNLCLRVFSISKWWWLGLTLTLSFYHKYTWPSRRVYWLVPWGSSWNFLQRVLQPHVYGVMLWTYQVSVCSSVLSRHNKDLEWRTLKPLVRHKSRDLDRLCYSS